MPFRSSLLAVVLLLAPVAAAAQEGYADAPGLEARIWLDRGTDPVLDRGDRVRIYYRTSHDAYVAIFHIDTDGVLRMVHPRGPGEEFVRGARDYRVLFPRSPYWYVDEYEGEGYFFAVASPEPFDFGAFRFVSTAQSWDLSAVGRTVYRDPYLAMDEVVAEILPDWEYIPYALDFISYDVGGSHEYPRFLCYDCHGFQSYASWNPYTYACTDFRVVVWNDPYFLPAYRYGPTRVVYSSALRGRARFELKMRDAGEAWTPLTRTRQPPARVPVQYKEPSRAAPTPARVVPPRRTVVPSERSRTVVPDRRSPAVERESTDARRTPTGTVVSPPLRRGGAATGSSDAAAPPARVVAPVRPERRPTLERRPGGVVRPSTPAGPSRVRPGGSVTAPDRARPTVRPGGPTRGPTRAVTPPRGPVRPSIRPTIRRPARPGGTARPTVRPSTGTRPPPVRRPARPPKRPKKSGNG